jgi:hypothetical protein
VRGPSNAPIERSGSSSGFPDERHYLITGLKTVNHYFEAARKSQIISHFLAKNFTFLCWLQ